MPTGNYDLLDTADWVASDDTQLSVAPFGAQSFEAFLWDEEWYFAYVLLDQYTAAELADLEFEPKGNQPCQWNSEIWVQKVNDPDVNCVVSEVSGPRSPHFEPEPIVLTDASQNQHVNIYYNEGAPAGSPLDHEFLVRVITITDKALFDQQCACGDVRDYAPCTP